MKGTGSTGLTHHQALTVGLLCYAIGAFCVWDAYENRGNSRPFMLRFVGGLI